MTGYVIRTTAAALCIALVLCVSPLAAAAESPTASTPVQLDNPVLLQEIALQIDFLPGDHYTPSRTSDFSTVRQERDIETVASFPHRFDAPEAGSGWYLIELPPLHWLDNAPPALQLGFIADFDEVWLNGTMIGQNHNIATGRADEAYGIQRLYQLPTHLLRQDGSNYLAVQVRRGGSYAGGIIGLPRVGPFRDFARSRLGSDILQIILSVFYFVTGLLFLALYLRRPASREYLYFSLVTISAAVYFSIRLTTVLQLLNNYGLATRIEYTMLWLLIPMFMLFFLQYFEHRLHWYHRVYMVFVGICVAAGWISPGTQFLAQLNFSLIQYSWILPIGTVLYVMVIEYRRSPTARTFLYATIILTAATILDIVASRGWDDTGAMLFWGQYLLFPYIMLIAALVLHQLVSLYGEVERLYILATRDGLTGTAIRNHVLMLYDRLLSLARRHHRPLAVLMADIDHFKPINDQYGHAAGDAVLQRVGSLLNSIVRHEDLVGRYGGEEFLVILPETTASSAWTIAERIRIAISKLRFDELHKHGITISIGLATFPDCGTDSESLLKAADAALYEAKRAGRNQVVTANTAGITAAEV
ncbi:GGDEF domain-containing protein [Spirochaeta africana]|uniref:diguanylate cyclase n=1 Tax=Spirochaeta africana (strain ATCC 700263 / DSM 8902 / Z-7692) TaxID=889378 RepID=H9UIM3_SPIAZ|nr:diguanylate cyclase [Spirochaeta africana]AFG37366.1 diguanylate cyclase (GGDEF) domain-containing protein [Spirochaeta africana DSM 8902]